VASVYYCVQHHPKSRALIFTKAWKHLDGAGANYRKTGHWGSYDVDAVAVAVPLDLDAT
jgi:hypothetical protein